MSTATDTLRTIDVPDAKLSALVTLVKELVRERGYAKDKTIQKFLAAGYKKEQVMELLLGIAEDHQQLRRPHFADPS